MWKFQTKVFLNADELHEITANNKKPQRSTFTTGDNGDTALETAIGIWQKSDNKAQKIIFRTMAQQTMMHIINCETAHDMWTKLHSVYEQKSATSIHPQQQRFYSFVKDPQDTLATHISKLENIVQQLKDSGESISESIVITKVLMTLPSTFSHFTSAWESTTAGDQTMTNLTSRLLIEKSRLVSSEFFAAQRCINCKAISTT